MCEYFFCEYLTGAADNRDPVENQTVTWGDTATITKFIPAEAIFPLVLDLLTEPPT